MDPAVPVACDLWREGVALLRDVGFPIFVAVWLLLRFERAMKELDERVKDATAVIQACGVRLRASDRPGS